MRILADVFSDTHVKRDYAIGFLNESRTKYLPKSALKAYVTEHWPAKMCGVMPVPQTCHTLTPHSCQLDVQDLGLTRSSSRAGGKTEKGKAPEKIRPAVQDAKNAYYQYEVPADGFCVIHSVLAHHPHLNYLALRASVETPAQEAAWADAFFKPLLTQYTSWLTKNQKVMALEDVIAFNEYSKTGTHPIDLEFSHITWMAEFFGYEFPITVVNSLNEYKTALILAKKTGNRKTFHAIRIEKMGSVQHASPVFSDTNMSFNLSASLSEITRILKEEVSSDALLNMACTLDDQTNIHAKFRKARDGKLAAEETVKVVQKEINSLVKENAFLAAPVVQAQKKVSYVPASRITRNDKTGAIEFLYSHDFSNIGDKFSELFSTMRIDLFRKPHKYCHPGLRILADYQHMLLLTNALNSGFVFEHAAKSHKVIGWLQAGGFSYDQINSMIKMTRPVCPETETVDLLYKRNHPAHPALSSVGDQKFILISGVVNVLQDVLYYPSVVEALKKAMGGEDLFFSVMNYPRETGRYHYFDNEGYFDVHPDGIVSKPRDNEPGYAHPNYNVPPSSFSWKLRERMFMNATCVHSLPTGSHSAHSAYMATFSRVAQYQVVDIDPPVVSSTINFMQSNGGEYLKSFAKGKAVYATTTDYLALARQEIHPHHPLQAFFSEKADFKGGDLDAVKLQFKFIERVIRAERLFADVTNGKPLELTKQFVYWCEQKNLSAKMLTAAFSHPVYGNHGHMLYDFENENGWLTRVRRYVSKNITPKMFFWQTQPALVETRAGGNGKKKRTKTLPVPAIKPAPETLIEDSTLTREKDLVPAQHFEQTKCRRFFHQTGNTYLNVTRLPDHILCTCKPEYERLVGAENPTQFGGCLRNAEAALKARQFNATGRPAMKHMASFKAFCLTYFALKDSAIREAIEELTVEDCSFETFLADSVPSKRKLYQGGWDRFMDRGYLPMHLDQFSKTNEVHYENPWDIRPRNLFNPSAECKAVAGLLARLMIRVLKKIEPGFISGYSETKLAAKIVSDCDLNGIDPDSPDWGMGDNGSHDALQNPEAIESVDHYFMKKYLPLILLKTTIPYILHEHVIKQLCLSVLKFSSKTGMKGSMTGTVYSGHPTRTTLFNTLRTILYHRYALALLAPEARVIIYASGDDMLMWVSGLSSWSKNQRQLYCELLGLDGRIAGLGQNIRDFEIGRLSELNFLSKKIHALPGLAAVHRLNARLLKAGAVRPLKSPLTPGEHAVAQTMCLVSIAPDQAPARDRWNALSKCRVNLRKINREIELDWGMKLRLGMSKPDPTFDHAVLFHDDQKPLLKMITERAGGRLLIPVRRAVHQDDGLETETQGMTAEEHDKALRDMALEKRLQMFAFIAQHARDGQGHDSSQDQMARTPAILSRRRPIDEAWKMTPGLYGPPNIMPLKEKKIVYGPQNKPKPRKQRRKQAIQRTTKSGPAKKTSSPMASQTLHDYKNTLCDPFTVRGVRVPCVHQTPTQVKNIHGNLSFVANSLGFARLVLGYWDGQIVVYNDATHTDTVLGAASVLLSGDTDIAGSYFRRVVSAGLKCRSGSSLTNDAGFIQSYSSLLGSNRGSYDVYIDNPHQKTYSRGQQAVVRYLPIDGSELFLSPNASSSVINYHVAGFMVQGATPGQKYFVEYSVNFEYVSQANTDLVPHVRTPGDDAKVVAELLADENASSDTWAVKLKDALKTYGSQMILDALPFVPNGGLVGGAFRAAAFAASYAAAKDQKLALTDGTPNAEM